MNGSDFQQSINEQGPGIVQYLFLVFVFILFLILIKLFFDIFDFESTNIKFIIPDDLRNGRFSDEFIRRIEQEIEREALNLNLKAMNLCWNQQKPLDISEKK